MTDQKIPEAARIKEFIAIIEWRAKISVNAYLGKAIPTPLQTKTYPDGEKYFGELNGSGKSHGRGIKLDNHGGIWIGYFEVVYSTGNYIYIHRDGDFRVGEY